MDLGFKVTQNMAEKPDKRFSSSLEKETGCKARLENGSILRPDIPGKLFQRALELYESGNGKKVQNLNHATGIVYCEFWKQWKKAGPEEWWMTTVRSLS
jgi:hypothetical protein